MPVKLEPIDFTKRVPARKKRERLIEVKKIMETDFDAKTSAYIKNKLAGMNKKEAVLAAGFKATKAQTIETPLIKKRMLEILDEAGLSDEAIVEDLKAGLRESIKYENNGYKIVAKPDYGVRHKYLETALKLKGELQGEKKEKEPIQILIVDYESSKNKSAT